MNRGSNVQEHFLGPSDYAAIIRQSINDSTLKSRMRQKTRPDMGVRIAPEAQMVWAPRGREGFRSRIINTMDINELSPTLTAWLQKEHQGVLLDVCLRLRNQISLLYRGYGYAV